ncbi:MAG: hypothetical protein C4K60_08070 [Ideonella sp. MAG2]|nr:MAG: hypothetical protein C4K60_08070 [Ideonella sp. MAG2]
MNRHEGDGPCCLMLPGLDGTGRLFEPLLTVLGDALPTRVVRYPPDPQAGYAELLDGLQQQIPPGVPLLIVAESFAGPLAIQLALRRPQQVRGMVLCCTFAANPRPGLSWVSGLLPWLPIVTSPTWPMLSLLMGRYGSTKARQQMIEVVAGLPVEVVRSRLAQVLAVDVRPCLAQLSQPVWLLQASDDALVPEHAIRTLSKGLAKVQHLSLKGPHALLQACPSEVAAVLEAAWQHCFTQQAAQSAF